MPQPDKALPPPTGYMHTRTFFQGARWSAHDLVGELLARGIPQIAIAQTDGTDWTVSWVEPSPPDVIKDAEETPGD